MIKASAVAVVCAALTLLTCARDKADQRVLSESAKVLDELARKPENAIPDAVLNRTTCLVTARLTDNASSAAKGVAICRRTHDQWSDPAFVSIAATDKRAAAIGDVLLLIVDGVAARSLASGELRLDRPGSIAAGPLARLTPVVTDAQLSIPVLSYVNGGGSFKSVAFHGRLQIDQESNNRFYGAKQQTVPNPLMRAASSSRAEKFANAVTSYFNTITPAGIVIHHSGIIPSEQKTPKNEKEVDRFHATRGMEIRCLDRVYHVAYHYLITPEGKVKSGRPERCEGAHAQGYNAYIGIALVGDFSSADNPRGERGPATPTAKQIEALVRLCRELRARYGIPLQRIVRHSDVSSTNCPGDRFPFATVIQQIGAS